MDFASLEAQFKDLSNEFNRQQEDKKKPVITDASNLLYLHQKKIEFPSGALTNIFPNMKHLNVYQEEKKESEESLRERHPSNSNIQDARSSERNQEIKVTHINFAL